MTTPDNLEIPTEFITRVVPSGRRLGLVVGIDSYQDGQIPKLGAAVADAVAMYALMIDPGCGRFATEHTVLLTNHEATERAVKRELERLRKNAGPDDEVWIFFAGHAILLDNEHRLLPVDSEHANLDASSIPFAGSARKIHCRRKIVFLDCCHSGATDASTRSVFRPEEVLETYPEGMITFCSSDGAEQSVELPEQARGAFSYWLERGMRGAADLDGNGVVTSTELWEFVQKHVSQDALRFANRQQTPRLKLDSSGAFYLTLNIEAVRHKTQLAQQESERQRALRAQEEAEVAMLDQLVGLQGKLTTAEGEAAIGQLQERASDVAQDIRHELETFSRDQDVVRAARAIKRILRDVLPPVAAVAKPPADATSIAPSGVDRPLMAQPAPATIPPSQPAVAAAAAPPAAPAPPPHGATEPQPLAQPPAFDEQTPVDVLRDWAGRGQVPAMVQFGSRLQQGLRVARDFAEAAQWYQKAADLGDRSAKFELGLCYFNGWGVKEDKVTAVTWFRQAADEGYAAAQRYLGHSYLNGLGVKENHDTALKWYRLAADQNDTLGQYHVGQCYMYGWGVKVDSAAAFKWFKKAGDQGLTTGQCAVGNCYLNGVGVVEDNAAAVEWYTKAAEQGDPLAQRQLGLCYINSWGVDQDRVAAVKWYQKAADQGDAIAQRALGDCFLQGVGVEEDSVEAVKWYQEAAGQGDAAAQERVGRCYLNGWGVEADVAVAFEWYQRAADGGDEDARRTLGEWYLNGIGVEEDNAAAFTWFQRAAEQGDAESLGMCYLYGVGVEEDKAAAVKWFEQAANEGHPIAQRYLGDCYLNGWGVVEDNAAAVEWYTKAAEQGDPSAQRQLGLCFVYGWGVPQDQAIANEYYRIAADAGDEFAKRELVLQILRGASPSPFCVAPEIPPKKLASACAYAGFQSPEECLALHDTTVFGSASDGLAVSTRGLHWHNPWEQPGFVEWTQLARIDHQKQHVVPVDAAGVSHAISVQTPPDSASIAALLWRVRQVIVPESPTERPDPGARHQPTNRQHTKKRRSRKRGGPGERSPR